MDNIENAGNTLTAEKQAFTRIWRNIKTDVFTVPTMKLLDK